jgi:hypothetical protein
MAARVVGVERQSRPLVKDHAQQGRVLPPPSSDERRFRTRA